MALNFPTSPANNQIYFDSSSGNRYKYNAGANVWFFVANNDIQGATGDTQVVFNDGNSANGSYGLTFNKTANTLTANTINAFSMRVTGNLYIGSNTVVISNNSIMAEALYIMDNGSPIAVPTGTVSNTSFTVANSAFAHTNTTLAHSQSVYAAVNSVFGVANAAFGSANNVAPQVAPAFNTANGGYTVANAAFGLTNNTYAAVNSAFAIINAAFASANNVAPQVAPAFNTANAAFNQSNSEVTRLSAGYVVANAAFSQVNTLATSANAYAASVGSSANAYSAATYVLKSGDTVTGTLSVVGDLIVSGNTRQINANTMSVSDPLIYLAANNYSSDIVDIGFIANYVNTAGANVHTGLYREHENKEYYLFQGYDKEPINNHIGAMSNNMTLSVLNADIRTSNLNLGGANAITWISSAYGVSNAAFAAANAKVATVSGSSGRITSSGTTGITLDLATAGAGAASYSSGISALTVDAYGRVTSVTGSASYVTSSGSITGSAGSISGLNNPPTNTGGTWPHLVKVNGDGAVEIGRYLDFHNGSADGIDYAVRLQTDGTTTGLSLNGNQLLTAGNYNSYALPLSGGTLSGALNIGTSTNLNFGNATRQMINLWSTSYGIGVQSATTYFRTGTRFSWHRGGVHSDTENDPGAGGTLAMTLDGSSHLTAYGSMRSPIFYDSDNTAYFINAAGTDSYLNHVRTNRLKLDVNYGHSIFGLYSSYRYQGIWSMGESWYLPDDGTTTGNLYGIAWSHPNAGGIAGNLASHGMLILENGAFQGAWGGGRLVTPSDIRGTLFYDYNDTSYYANPNSSSNMNSITLNNITLNNTMYFPSSAGGATFNSNHYSMGKDIANGGWSDPHYSDLIIGYHTGIRIGAHYSGIRFYSNSPTTDANNDGNGDGGETLIMTVGGHAGGQSYVIAHASFRAPIFYDYNDTAYYANPNGLSSFAGIDCSSANYNTFRTWTNLTGTHGFYSSSINGAHFYPNNGSYGAWRIDGTRNGWNGIEFAGHTTLMMNDNAQGFHRNTGGGWRFYVESGNGYFPGNVSAYWSDGRLKENLRPIGREAIDIINKFTTYRFNWNNKVEEFELPIEVGKEEIGMIAQDVQQVLPDAVTINKSACGSEENRDYLTINYDRITPILAQALKETVEELNELKQLLKDKGIL